MSLSNTSNTVSEKEVSKFNTIAPSWWNPVGDFEALHKLNPPRLEFIVGHICHYFQRDQNVRTPLNSLRVLDIGCGGGLLCEPLARLGASVTGIDAGDKNISVARKHSEKAGLTISYQQMIPEKLSEKKKKFDVVLNMEVLEHTNNLNLLLESTANLIKPGGVMVASTLNRTLKSLVLGKVVAEYILRWIPTGTHDWEKFIRPSELSNALSIYGVKIANLSGLSYSISRDTWYLSKDLTINYLAFGTKGH